MVIAGGRQGPAVGGKVQRPDPIVVPLCDGVIAPRDQVLQSQRPITAGDDEDSAVRRKCERRNAFGGPDQGRPQSTRRHVPEQNR